MLASIPLTEEEQAAVEDGQGAVDGLLRRLATTPTPAGLPPSPDASRSITEVHAKKPDSRASDETTH